MDILVALSPSVIQLPTTLDEWRSVAEEFEESCGFPDVGGAVDGSLIRIERPFEYDGWICRKGFASINMQATVDAKGRFIEYSLRPGSCSDKNVWNMSSLGSRILYYLPELMHFLGDAGYTLASFLMTPYLIYDGMPRDESCYNYLHSRTRNIVERAFGGLKGRWRILKRTLNMKTPASCGRTIVSCMVLHNLTIDAGDDTVIDDRIDPYLHCNVPIPIVFPNQNLPDRHVKRDMIKDYLNALH